MALEQIKELRSMTGCGMVDCKEALEEADGDLDNAVSLLRKKGKVKAAKKSDRETAEGVVSTYVHGNNKLGVMVKLLCETDFVARNDRFQELAHDIALHIAAMEPIAITPEEVDVSMVEKEKELAEEQAKESGKPEDIQAKMVEGKINKFKEEKALLRQPFVKDPSKVVQDIIDEAVQELGENISVAGFYRMEI